MDDRRQSDSGRLLDLAPAPAIGCRFPGTSRLPRSFVRKSMRPCAADFAYLISDSIGPLTAPISAEAPTSPCNCCDAQLCLARAVRPTAYALLGRFLPRLRPPSRDWRSFFWQVRDAIKCPSNPAITDGAAPSRMPPIIRGVSSSHGRVRRRDRRRSTNDLPLRNQGLQPALLRLARGFGRRRIGRGLFGARKRDRKILEEFARQLLGGRVD